jgi:hypothetical protein
MEKDYTLIVGAGASKALSSKFGLGAELLTQISQRVTDKTTPEGAYLSNVLDDEGLKVEVREDFVRHLEKYMKTVETGSIDGYLDEVSTYPEYLTVREDFLKIGKFMIMIHILGYEGEINRDFVKSYPENSWIDVLARFIEIEKLLEGDISKQTKLKIITFNYDRTIEKYLFDHPIMKGKSKELNRFFETSLVHVYGKLDNLPENETKEFLKFGEPNPKHPEIFLKRDNIQTVYSERSIKRSFPETAKDWVTPVHENGLDILAFGFAFDLINASLLSLQDLHHSRKQQIIANIYACGDTDFKRRRGEASNIRSINYESKLSYNSCDDFLRKYLL